MGKNIDYAEYKDTFNWLVDHYKSLEMLSDDLKQEKEYASELVESKNKIKEKTFRRMQSLKASIETKDETLRDIIIQEPKRLTLGKYYKIVLVHGVKGGKEEIYEGLVTGNYKNCYTLKSKHYTHTISKNDLYVEDTKVIEM